MGRFGRPCDHSFSIRDNSAPITSEFETPAKRVYVRKLYNTHNSGTIVQQEFMRRAIALSLENVKSGRGGPFGAVVVRGSEIIGEGTNQVTSTNDPSAHAEVLAVRAACQKLRDFQLKGCEIYSSCEPCPMCLSLIYWARLERVYYASAAEDAAAIGFDDSRIHRELQSEHSSRSIPMVQLLRDDALAAFRAWQQKPDKLLY